MIGIDERARHAGLSIARLCREAGVGYRRVYEGRRLTEAEQARLAAALAQAEEKKKEVAVASADLSTRT